MLAAITSHARRAGILIVAVTGVAIAGCHAPVGPASPAAPADPHARSRPRLAKLGDDVEPKLALLYKDGDIHDRAWVARQLIAMAEVEQQVRAEMEWPAQANLDTYETEYFLMSVIGYLQQIDARNLAVVRRLVAVHGWFPISTWGEQAEAAAWILVQHADSDPGFQREVLARMEPLVVTHDTKPSRYALLFDRVALAEGRPQRYGTQGNCTGRGVWVAADTEDPAQLDRRRASVGLPPMKVYIESARPHCP